MITLSNNKLWGVSGGELEYVSQRVAYRQRVSGLLEKWHAVMVVRFTDHDVQADDQGREGLIEGKYYELEFPISTEE